MTLPILKRVLCCACALGITWTASGKADAGFPFFHNAWYAPSPYTAYYGYGLWGTNYVSYYTPSYYSYDTPSYYYTTSYYAPVYTTAYAPCGVSCDPCAVSCCDPCGACGLAACYGCGFASVSCPTDCPTGIGSPPMGQSEPIPPYSGGNSTPETFQDPNRDERYQTPVTPQQNEENGLGSGPDGTGAGPGGGVFPPGGGGAEFERDVRRPIPPSEAAAPAKAEPSSAPGTSDEPPPPGEDAVGQPPEEEEVDVPPADIDTLLAAGVGPARSRARYTVRFVAPRVARLEITPRRSRTHGEAGPQLAATE